MIQQFLVKNNDNDDDGTKQRITPNIIPENQM
jgi:hypothetical protein